MTFNHAEYMRKYRLNNPEPVEQRERRAAQKRDRRRALKEGYDNNSIPCQCDCQCKEVSDRYISCGFCLVGLHETND